MPYNEAMGQKLPDVHYAIPTRQTFQHRATPRRIYRPKWLLGLGVLLVILGLVRVVSQPVHGHNTAVDIQLKKPAGAKSAPVTPASQQQNTYYTLDLPPGYHAAAGDQTVPGLLYAQLITKPGALGSLIINVAVATLPAGGLSENSSYRLRVQQANRYQATTESRSGDTLQIYQDSQSGEVTAFWPHRSYLATIAVSSVLNNPGNEENSEVRSVLQTMITGWQWR